MIPTQSTSQSEPAVPADQDSDQPAADHAVTIAANGPVDVPSSPASTPAGGEPTGRKPRRSKRS